MLKIIIKSTALIITLLLLSMTAQARNMVEVDMNASTYVNVGSVITRITSGNPSIAIVKQVDPTLKTGFLVEGHEAGTTTVLVWTLEGDIKECMNATAHFK